MRASRAAGGRSADLQVPDVLVLRRMEIMRYAGWGAFAGAAGTTALNAATYLDMAARGRPSSSTPEDTVEALAGTVGVEVPGDDET